MAEGKSRIAWDILVLAIIAAVFLTFVIRFNFLTDDSFISFRYADNFAHGHGLRYNINENPPVEGFTGFLWVLVLAFFIKLGADPTIASRIVSISCGLALLVSFYWACRRILHLDRIGTFLGTLSLASFPPFFIWATGGLETMPFALCWFLLFLTFLGAGERIPVFRAGILGLTLLLLRPEGMGYSLLIAAFFGGYKYLRDKKGPWFRSLFGYVSIIVGGTVLLTIWRLIYFHSPLPNTFYAKVGFTSTELVRGWDYVVSFMLTFPGVLVILVLAAGIARSGRHRTAVSMSLALSLTLMIITIVLGGDFMTMARFLVPVLSLLSLPLAILASKDAIVRGGKAYTVMIAAALLIIGIDVLPAFNIHVTPSSWREAFFFRWSYKTYQTEIEFWQQMKTNLERFEVMGNTLAEIATPDQSVVAGGIGAIGYYSRMKVYDRYGLVSREVARSEIDRDPRSAGHDKSADAFFFYELHPDYYHPHIVPAKDLEKWKIKLSRDLIQRSKSDGRRDLVRSAQELRETYTVYSKPVAYEYKGEKMVFIAYKSKTP